MKTSYCYVILCNAITEEIRQMVENMERYGINEKGIIEFKNIIENDKEYTNKAFEIYKTKYFKMPMICEYKKLPNITIKGKTMPFLIEGYFTDVITGRVYRQKRETEGQWNLISEKIVLDYSRSISKSELCELLKELKKEDIERYTAAQIKLENAVKDEYLKEKAKTQEQDNYIKSFKARRRKK